MNWIRGLGAWGTKPAKTADPKENHNTTQRGEAGKRIVGSDNPIRSPDQDLLGREPIARSFAKEVLALDASEGLVVGVLGAWGSGKTSFVNLARHEFSRTGAVVLDFNPWMFSGAEQLVESFFVELSAQLKVRPNLADVGRDLEDYGETFAGMAWLPLVGPWIERGRGATKVISKILQRRKEGVGARREKLEKALSALAKPILVVLDDIDRLSTSEIRDVFKLVRLTASFPNIAYILAFDRARVEQALAEQGVPGRDYLEKILQLAEDLPALPQDVLDRQVFSALDTALADIEKTGPFDERAWPDVFSEIIRPLVRNMRDVRRYTGAIRRTVPTLDGHVALGDVLALEAVRVFMPDVFERLHGAVEGLTTPARRSSGYSTEPPHLAIQVQALVEAAEGRSEVVRSLISRLFPAGCRHIGGSNFGTDWESGWLRERRIAHQEILRLYLERVVGKTLRAFADAESAWSCMADTEAFDRYLRSIALERLEDVIGALEAYEDDFAREHVVPGTTVLLNLLPELPERQRGFFEPDTRLVVTRVVYRLIRSLGDPVATESVVREILPRLDSLSAKFEILNIIGYREHAGHKLVSEEVARNLESEWRQEVLSTSFDSPGLTKEYDLLRVFLFTKREAGESDPQLNIPATPEVTLALIRTARTEVKSQSMGSRAVRRSPRLAWDVLVEVYDTEETLEERVECLIAAQPEGAEDVLDLARQYLDGWRPGAFGDGEED